MILLYNIFLFKDVKRKEKKRKIMISTKIGWLTIMLKSHLETIVSSSTLDYGLFPLTSSKFSTVLSNINENNLVENSQLTFVLTK